MNMSRALQGSEELHEDSNVYLKNVRRAALLACVATVFGLLIPTWTSVHQMLAINANGVRWWIPLAVVFGLILSAVSPLFYFTLYRDRGDLQISRNLRLVSAGAALTLALLVAFRAASWIESFTPASVLSQSRERWTTNDASTLLGICADLGVIILLITLYRHRERRLVVRPVSTSLRIITRISVIVFGVTTAIALIRLVLAPYWAAPLREAMTQAERTPPSVSYFVLDSVRALFIQACSLAAPFVVWCASPAARRENETGR
jgi:hypothetical protein